MESMKIAVLSGSYLSQKFQRSGILQRFSHYKRGEPSDLIVMPRKTPGIAIVTCNVCYCLNLNTVHSMSGEIVAIEHSEMKKK